MPALPNGVLPKGMSLIGEACNTPLNHRFFCHGAPIGEERLVALIDPIRNGTRGRPPEEPFLYVADKIIGVGRSGIYQQRGGRQGNIVAALAGVNTSKMTPDAIKSAQDQMLGFIDNDLAKGANSPTYRKIGECSAAKKGLTGERAEKDAKEWDSVQGLIITDGFEPPIPPEWEQLPASPLTRVGGRGGFISRLWRRGGGS